MLEIKEYNNELLQEVSYCRCYCEENIYLLTKKYIQSSTSSDVIPYVLFISSISQQTPIWCQKSAKNKNSPVFWDYHVILILYSVYGNGNHHLAYDLDSYLPSPISLKDYITQSFRPHLDINHEHQQMFRVIPGEEFLEHFASDRSHMVDSKVVPPNWPLIKGKKVLNNISHNLDQYISMSLSQSENNNDDNNNNIIGFGKVYLLDQFLEWCQYSCDDTLKLENENV